MAYKTKIRAVSGVIIFLNIILLCFFTTPVRAGYYDYSDVLLIVNDNSAISVQIGDYFKQQRNIPDINVVHLHTVATEGVSRTEFTNNIRTPIENHLISNNLKDSINYIVTTKGVPLTVSDTAEAVNQELMLILGPYASSIGTGGSYAYSYSPYSGKDEKFSHAKFGIYLTTRLDGYSWDDIKALIDRSNISVTADNGTFILDVDPGRDGGVYQEYNDYMRQAAPLLRAKGYNVVLDETTTFLTNQQNVLGYFSWGSNDGHDTNNAIPGNTYVNGAIGDTLVSTSARSFNYPPSYGQSLIADLIHEGISGVSGYVSEPYTTAIAMPQILFVRYTSGYNLADSFGMATRLFQWKQVLIGDPKTVIVNKPAPPPVDTIPPVRVNGSPRDTLPAGTNQTTMSLSTDETATCRYSTTANISYDSMTNAFATTGETSHSTVIASLSNGSAYNYYVRCKDAAGNANTDDYIISFSIAVPDVTAPAAITDLSSSNIDQNKITLAWTAPGDDNNTGTAKSYDIRFSTFALSESNWTNAAQAQGESAPQIAGTKQSYTLTELLPNTSYYFAIKTSDEASNVSNISNIYAAKTLTVDITPPSVYIASPANGAVVQETITIQANATDDRGIASVQFKIDDVSIGSEDTASPYSISWNTNVIANGIHNITAVAKDSSNNVSTSSPVAVTVNNPSPTLFVSLTGQGNPGSNYSLTATVSGTAAGLTDYTFYCDRQDSGANITYPYNAQYLSSAETTITAQSICKYRKAGTYTAKVIAQRQGLAVESRVTLVVQTSKGEGKKGTVAGKTAYQTKLAENSLVKQTDNPNVYLIRNGQKIPIPSVEALTKSGFSIHDIKTASSKNIQDTITASLTKSASNDRVYLLKQNRKLLIPSAEDFEANGYQWENIVPIPEALANSIPNATLVKTDNYRAVYALNNETIRHILNSDIFNSYNYKWNDIVTITADELNVYKIANLVKGENNDSVYLLENNQKKKIISLLGSFNNYEFDWLNVQTVNQTEINAYENAGEIK